MATDRDPTSKRPRHVSGPRPVFGQNTPRPSVPKQNYHVADAHGGSISEALAMAISTKNLSCIPSLVNTALSTDYQSISTEAFLSALYACKQHGDINGTIRIFQMGLEHQNQVMQHMKLSQLVSCLYFLASHQDRTNTVINILNKLDTCIKQLKPDTRLLVGLANAAIKQRANDNAIRYIDWISQHELPMNQYAFAVLFKVYGRCRNVVRVRKHATELLETRPVNIEMDHVLFNAILDALVRCDDIRYAKQLLFNQSYIHVVNTMSYNIVIGGMACHHQNQRQRRKSQTQPQQDFIFVRDAFRLVSRMQATGLDLDAITINSLISACVSAQQFNTAKGLLAFYQRPAFCSSEADNLFQLKAPSVPRPPTPPANLKNTLLPKDENSVSTALSSISSDNNDDVQADPVIEINLCKDETLADGQANEYAERQRVKQFRIAMTTLLCGLAENGQIKEAFTMLNEMKDGGIRPNAITYASLIASCFKYGFHSEALDLFESVDSQFNNKPVVKDKTIILHAVIKGLCRHAPDEEAIDQADEIIDAYLQDSYKRPVLTTHVLNIMIDGHVQIRRFDRAEHYIRMMNLAKDLRPTQSSYTTLMKGYCQAGKYKHAKRTFGKMTRSMKIDPDSIALNTLITTCVHSADTSTALKVLSYMERSANNVSAQSYSALLLMYARRNDFVNLMTLYHRMRRRHNVPINDYIIDIMAEYVLKQMQMSEEMSDLKMKKLAIMSRDILEDGLQDLVSLKLLRYNKRKLVPLFPKSIQEHYFSSILSNKQFQSVSESIFQKHGWNNISSGWRFL